MCKVIPRFLYHLTNRVNYDSIMKSKTLKTTAVGDLFEHDANFMIELTNLFKHWRKDPKLGGINFQKKFIDMVSKDTSNIVILKIPTKELNVDCLRIRDIKKVTRSLLDIDDKNALLNQKYQQAIDEYLIAKYKYVEAENAKVDKSLPFVKIQRLKDKILQEFTAKHPFPQKEYAENYVCLHTRKGEPAAQRKLFEYRKEAIEYIYPEDIPTSQIEKIGEVNLDELKKTAEYDPLRPMRSLFSALLRGTPQEKGALLLNG